MSEFTSNDPSELVAVQPSYPTREQTQKTVQDKYPGHIAWATDRASFSGCRMLTFTPEGVAGLEEKDGEVFEKECAGKILPSPAAWINQYFSTRANLLVLNMAVNDYGIHLLVTTQLDAEDLEELEEVQRRVQLDMREWRERKAEEREKAEDEIRENQRLIALAKQWEAHNLPGKVKELEAKLAELRRQPENG